MDFIYRLDGVHTADDKVTVRFHNAEGDLEFQAAALHVAGKVGLSETIFGDDFRFLQDAVTSAVPKLTIPSPSMVHYRGGRAAINENVYPEVDAFWTNLVAAYREQVRGLGELGCTYLQVGHVEVNGGDEAHAVGFVFPRAAPASAA